jgi:lipoprotein-anchoring transpeptidase ErfK/SrfK
MHLRLAAALALAAAPALALTPGDIRDATYEGGDLGDGQTGLTFVTQVLLDRADISPGIIDGYKGGMSESAIRAFEAREGFTVDGMLDPQVWEALGGPSAAPVLTEYRITEEDVSGLTESIPEDYAELAEMQRLGYTRVSEKLAERFHMDEDVLVGLNDGTAFEAGETILVADPGPRMEAEVARIEIDKQARRARVFDAAGKMLTSYPVTVGSAQLPSPSGTVEITAIAMDPNYTYRPDENFQQGDNDEKLIVPPGPNGPVGSVWLDLSKPTYGLHGTAEPGSLFAAQSHGCVRFTNWDIEELAHVVEPGVTVEFMQ